MKSLLFEKFAKHAKLRAAFWGIIGILLFVWPEFLLGGLFYALVGYVLLDGIGRVIDFVRVRSVNYVQKRDAFSSLSYFSLVIAILQLVIVIHAVYFRRFLIQATPVYLGGYLLLEGIIYFVIARCANTIPQKRFLVPCSLIVFWGGVVILVFTFGFGVGGLHGLAIISGGASMLACFYEVAICCVCRKNTDTRLSGGNLQ